jgi:hypothetical protein
MHEYLDEIQGKLNKISSAIYNSFFCDTNWLLK